MREVDLSKPETTAACFYNALFGHTRNWPRAYSCLGPAGRARFDSEHGLQSFADYWDDRLSFLEALVRNRHSELPYTHRTCFLLDRLHLEEVSEERAVVSVELAENHLPPKMLTISQTKTIAKQGKQWLLTNGELEGNLDNIITVRRCRHHVGG